jgi:hypothetical protein
VATRQAWQQTGRVSCPQDIYAIGVVTQNTRRFTQVGTGRRDRTARCAATRTPSRSPCWAGTLRTAPGIWLYDHYHPLAVSVIVTLILLALFHVL